MSSYERFIGAALANFPRALMAFFPPPSVLEISSDSVTVVDAKLSSSLPVLSEYSDLLESDDD